MNQDKKFLDLADELNWRLGRFARAMADPTSGLEDKQSKYSALSYTLADFQEAVKQLKQNLK
ncbi:hypothetical protein [Microviridae Bog1249_12]|uniref:hypothetical protein n=1 Tax=Microviridae Bog1249_12 TaxID=1655647 RepID=UPI00063D5E79|nr:hypothetical protein [Microviridae Bog1249_12]AKI26876.1 hypothetical protein [Microviridae Bog1249_12]